MADHEPERRASPSRPRPELDAESTASALLSADAAKQPVSQGFGAMPEPGRGAAPPPDPQPLAQDVNPTSRHGGYAGMPVDAYSATLSDDVQLLAYLRVLHKRRWTAVATFVVVLGSVTIYTYTATPIYQATVRLLIESENPNIVSFQEVIEQDKATNDYYQTQYRILEGRALAKRTLAAANLWTHPEFAGTKTPGPVASALAVPMRLIGDVFSRKQTRALAEVTETQAQTQTISRFLANLTVTPVRNSRLVDVTYESPDPELTARVANELADAFIDQNLEFKFLATKEATDWLVQRMAEQRKEVEAGELALQAYRERNDAVSLEERQNIVVQRLADLNAVVTKARTVRIEKEAQYNQLRGIQVDRAALDTFPAILANPFIQQLKGEVAELQRQQAQLGDRLGERHPDMAKLRSALQTADAKLQGEIGKVVQSIRNEFQVAQAQERSLMAALDEQKVEALALNRKAIEYGVLQRDSASNRQIFDGLLQRARETGISGELKSSNIRIVDHAEVPQGPARPRPVTNLLLALFGGSLLAVGLALFFERLDNRIRSPEEIKVRLGLPFLGMVPAITSKAFHRNSPLLLNGVPPGFAEAFRVIRTNVLFSSAEEGCRSLVITSAHPGEGKTVVAANLAVALAQAGQRVLLIDGDLRKPRMHDLFGQEQEPGLSNLMVGNAKASEAVRKSEVAGLWVMTSGTIPPNPAELLGSKRFGDFLARLREHFDWVLVDSPPVMAVTDASVVAHATSGVLFVVGAEMASRQTAQAALEQLESVRARFVGAILNRVDLQRNGYYYSQYYHRQYSQYYHTPSSGTSSTAVT